MSEPARLKQAVLTWVTPYCNAQTSSRFILYRTVTSSVYSAFPLSL
jgi:hypothetical protein